MSNARYSAPAPVAKHVPAFMVEKLDGERDVTVVEKTTKGLVPKTVKKPMGWLVTFPKGHSIHVETEEEMIRLGFDAAMVPLVKASGEAHDESEDVEFVPNVGLKGTKK